MNRLSSPSSRIPSGSGGGRWGALSLMIVLRLLTTAETLAGERDSVSNQSVIVGTLVQVTRLPDPKRTPYADCLFTATFEAAGVVSGPTVEPRIILLLPGFLGRQYQKESSYTPSIRLKARVIPHASMPDRIQQIQQIDDSEEATLPRYYAATTEVVTAFDEELQPTRARTRSDVLTYTPIDRRSPRARTERRRLVQHDLSVIKSLLQEHGGNWDRWYDETRACRQELAEAIREGRAGWLGDTYFAASSAASDRLYDPAFVHSLIAFRDYLENRHIDLIVLRIPMKGEVCADIFSRLPPGNTYNPRLLQFYADLLEADVEVVTDVIAEATHSRTNWPLMYWYQDPTEGHPAEGISWVIARSIAKRLSRYDLTETQQPMPFLLRETSETNRNFRTVFVWPRGNPRFPAGAPVRYQTVMTRDRLPLPVTQANDSPVLMLGSSYIAGPNMAVGASVPHYLAYLTGHVPNIFCRYGSDDSIPRSLAREGDGFLTNRVVCVFPVHPIACYSPLTLPAAVDVDRVQKQELATYSGPALRQHLTPPAGLPIDVFTFNDLDGVAVRPANGSYGAAGLIALAVPDGIAAHRMFAIEIVFSSRDYTRLIGSYAGQTDRASRTTNMPQQNVYLVFKTTESRVVDLDFAQCISNANPTRVKQITVYGLIEPQAGGD